MPIPEYIRNESDNTDIISIPFHIDNVFGFNLGNDWQNLVLESSGEMLITLYNLYSMTKLSGSWPKFKVVSRAMQALSWKSSKNPEFSNNAVLVCTRHSYNPTKIMEILSASCLPIYRNDVPKEQQGPALNGTDGVWTKFGETGRTVANKIKGLSP